VPEEEWQAAVERFEILKPLMWVARNARIVTNAADPFDSPEQGNHRGSRQSRRRHSPSADNSRIHVFKGCFWNETCWPQARARHEVPRTSLRCHLHIALPCLHLILRDQPAFANNVAFDKNVDCFEVTSTYRLMRTQIKWRSLGFVSRFVLIFRSSSRKAVQEQCLSASIKWSSQDQAKRLIVGCD
jgi:hypothetical protein